MLKQIPFKPWTGLLDVRTPPDLMQFGSFRRRMNWMCSDTGKLERRDGYRRLLHDADVYNNHDLHDQLLPLVTNGSAVREPITLLKEITSTWGTRYLIAGTKSRIYQLNETTGNWRIIADGFGSNSGGIPLRWRVAQSLNTLVFTNNWDKPVSYEIDAPAEGSDLLAVRDIADLDAIKLEKAACITQFKDIIIFGNVVMNGERLENALVWSTRFDGTSFDPAKIGSLAGYQPLANGERILNMLEFGDSIYVYTDKRIWKGTATGDTPALAFVTIYESHDGDRCLTYPNTLVSTGDTHLWMSRDGIYSIDAYTSVPELRDWSHAASDIIYSDINTSDCDGHIGCYYPLRKEVMFFWVQSGGSLPTRGLSLYIDDNVACEVDHGATAACVFKSDARISLRDWLFSLCVCGLDGLSDVMVKEGMPAQASAPACQITPQFFLTEDTTTIDGVETEDWEKLSYDAGSLASFIGDDRPDALCVSCNEDQMLVIAGDDHCLKRIGGAYARETCTNASSTNSKNEAGQYYSTTGEYSLSGYYSIIVSGPMDFGSTDTLKAIHRFILDADAADSAQPAALALRIGFAHSPLDPNDGGCAVLWTGSVRRILKCRNQKSAADYYAQRIRPSIGIEWPLYASGRYLYFELTIGSLEDQDNLKSSLLPCVGGACKVSGALMNVRRK